MKAYRQGDVVLIANANIPEDAKQLKHRILAEGEITGHKHQVAEGEALLYEKDNVLYMRAVSDKVHITHEEHGLQVVPKDDYKVFIPQEFDYVQETNRRIQD